MTSQFANNEALQGLGGCIYIGRYSSFILLQNFRCSVYRSFKGNSGLTALQRPPPTLYNDQIFPPINCANVHLTDSTLKCNLDWAGLFWLFQIMAIVLHSSLNEGSWDNIDQVHVDPFLLEDQWRNLFPFCIVCSWRWGNRYSRVESWFIDRFIKFIRYPSHSEKWLIRWCISKSLERLVSQSAKKLLCKVPKWHCKGHQQFVGRKC